MCHASHCPFCTLCCRNATKNNKKAKWGCDLGMCVAATSQTTMLAPFPELRLRATQRHIQCDPETCSMPNQTYGKCQRQQDEAIPTGVPAIPPCSDDEAPSAGQCNEIQQHNSQIIKRKHCHRHGAWQCCHHVVVPATVAVTVSYCLLFAAATTAPKLQPGALLGAGQTEGMLYPDTAVMACCTNCNNN